MKIYFNSLFMITILIINIGCHKSSNDLDDLNNTTNELKIEFGEFKDLRDNRIYKTVKIGEQVWMAENLAYLPKINYVFEGSKTTPHYYVYDYQGIYVEENLMDLFQLCLIKLKVWEPEDENRYLRFNFVNRKCSIKSSIFKVIIIGQDMMEDSKVRLIKYVFRKYQDCKIYIAEKPKNDGDKIALIKHFQ